MKNQDVSIEVLASMEEQAKEAIKANIAVTLDPNELMRVLGDLYWARLAYNEQQGYFEELQEVIKDLKELADWESDEWEAVERLGSIRERLGIK